MNRREVRVTVRREVVAHLSMIEEAALAEWVGVENVDIALDELLRIRRRIERTVRAPSTRGPSTG